MPSSAQTGTRKLFISLTCANHCNPAASFDDPSSATVSLCRLIKLEKVAVSAALPPEAA